jgi:hypothetical protein
LGAAFVTVEKLQYKEAAKIFLDFQKLDKKWEKAM